MSVRPAQDPLAPIRFIVTVLVAVPALSLLLVACLAALGIGSGPSWHWEHRVCVDVTTGTLQGTQEPIAVSRPLPAGVTVFAPVTRACTEHPTGRESLWAGLADVPGPLYALGVIVMVAWAIRQARRHGIFSVNAAEALSCLGWYVLLGSVTAHITSFIGDLRLYALLVPDAGWPRSDIPISVAGLLTGLGLVSLARVMRHAVLLQEEVDLTV